MTLERPSMRDAISVVLVEAEPTSSTQAAALPMLFNTLDRTKITDPARNLTQASVEAELEDTIIEFQCKPSPDASPMTDTHTPPSAPPA